MHRENISDIYLSASRSLAYHTSLRARGNKRTVLTLSEKLHDARGYIISLDKCTVFKCWWGWEEGSHFLTAWKSHISGTLVFCLLKSGFRTRR